MSLDALPEVSVADQDYAQTWAESTSRVLESLAGAPFTATPRPPGAAETAVAAAGESLWVRYNIAGRLEGEQVFQFTRSDGVRLAQLLRSEPMDGAAAFTENHTEALGKLFRQIAGLAATVCKTKYGADIQYEMELAAAPEWKPAGSAAWIFAAPQVAPIQWTLLLSPELHASLEAAREVKSADLADAASPEPAAAPEVPVAPETVSPVKSAPREPSAAHAPEPEPESPSTTAPAPANLDLLLDVELEASLRFGQREMLLREILELRPGSVVELDRHIQEPAELLVAGRVIARGEVVIVDGNYGLRITDIAQPRQRLESLET